jgi:pyridoxamine 5'-phosphate oxidase
MDPLLRFAELLSTARRNPLITEPTTMTLATVGGDGRPSARVMLLKGVDARGFTFYTNYHSRKGREVLAHPEVALVFHWIPLETQVRVEGRAAPVTATEADEYFAGRPRGSQLGAWASDQSSTLDCRATLEARLAEATARYQGQPVPRPPHWSGFRVTPLAIEFWRNRVNRLHERELYTRASADAPWTMRLLNP